MESGIQHNLIQIRFKCIKQLDNQWSRLTQSFRYIYLAQFKKSIQDSEFKAFKGKGILEGLAAEFCKT
ncbi:hypothetical protein BpHYR1_025762 [Brachionus plicatilis]|uniref:Uncharacterized protein n=1 Tax=Brachionus plicatilis TaxID=10195 RepID=A0A3M7RZQ0_BRAPC|nr:hypothetical protein BpHYR1_025762 [Brachionus plicatilis]